MQHWPAPAMALGLALTALAWAGDASPTHAEAKSLDVAAAVKGARIASLSMAPDGSLLACDTANKALLVLSPEGKLVARWAIPFEPQSVCAPDAETLFVGGQGQVARLDKAGKVVKAVEVAAGEARAGGIAAIATGGKDVFVAAHVGFSFSVIRFTADLAEPTLIVQRLRGCCGQMHIVAQDGVLYAAENARHRVARFDRGGKELGAWGEASRTSVDGFASCCNPMNVCFGPGGELYTSESQGRVKRYTPDGKFLGLVGTPSVGGGCLNVSVAVSKDASRVFVLDTDAGAIRVLEKK
jgi:sugar lactone lactonase YvrE